MEFVTQLLFEKIRIYINSSKNASAPHLFHKSFNTVLFKQIVVYARIQESP